MIVRELTKPIDLFKEEALALRLPGNYPLRAELDDSIGRRKAGYRGEKALDYYLHFLPDSSLVFRGTRIPTSTSAFQIDNLILTSSAAIIVEVKHLSGNIFFDQTFDQFIRKDENGKEERFSNPIAQVDRQKIKLRNWLRPHLTQPLPIDHIIVFTHPHAILDTNMHDDPRLRNIVYADHMLDKVKELTAKYKKEVLSRSQLFALRDQLLKSDRPLDVDVLGRFGVRKEDVMKGVQCPGCGRLGMKRVQMRWQCPFCGNRDLSAHERAVYDYFLLMGKEITNQQCRLFLQIDSSDSVYKFLNGMKLRQTGVNRGRKYHIPQNIAEVLAEHQSR
ncbi:NERD domain-containing protein [Pontibacillus yanchengensis]|uniref:NERD domain-containing protein n=1 Tax=Pontibacillus yanchengensis Y32 TaxID=1385514 RepID=A0A0A2TKY2_9BACI|nr:NERD domain-containing protein [Pontibacillus yanchengensis]KGP74726.1 hypothetical protein N782_01085 [Pontibacillus yanchengensis Y32]